MIKYYKIAGLTVEMDTYGRTEKQSLPYLTEKKSSDIVIQADKEALINKYKELTIPDDDLEYIASGISFYKQLLNYEGLMLHSSAVVFDGEAYLFSAKSGVGKSTHTALWLEKYGDRAYILNDDKPALRYENGVWLAYGTPWSGKYDISVNIGVPVKAICFIHRASENSIERFVGPGVIVSLMQQTGRPVDGALRIKLLEALDCLVRKVPIYRMGCNISVEAAELSYETMSKSMLE